MTILKICFLFFMVSYANAGKYITAYASKQGLTYFGDSRSWCSAVQACVWRNQHLGVINSETLNLVSESIIPDGGNAWLGASDMYTEGHWLWVDSEQVYGGYEKWGLGEPNNVINEDCMQAGAHGTYYWNDEPCDNNYGYVCQIGTVREVSAMYAVLSFSDATSSYDSRTSFWNAQKACENRGMRLARVESKKELKILRKKLPRNSNEKYWIGTEHDKCAEITRDQLFNECSSTSLPYICEVVSPYSVEVTDESPKIHENDNLQIDCNAKGFPLPDVFWYKDGERITEQTDQNVHQSIGSASATLKIHRAQMGDAGQYRCYATNTAIDFELRVFGLLHMEVYPEGREITQEK